MKHKDKKRNPNHRTLQTSVAKGIPYYAGGLSRVGLTAVGALVFLAMMLLAFGSLLGTADMSTDNPMKELIIFGSDPLLRNLLSLILMIALGGILILLLRTLGWTQRIRPWMLAVGLGVWVTVLGGLWLAMSLSLPTQDSYVVTAGGIAAANGDLSFVDIDYFVRFPFQLGYVFWTELWGRLLGLTHADYLVLEAVNVLCLAFGEAALVLITDQLFRNREVNLGTTLTLAAFIQPVIFSTFLYGTIPGFCFAAWSIYFFIRYLKTDRYRFMIPSALCLAVSVSLKLNNMILLVAMCIILLAHLLRGKPWKRLLAVGILCVAVTVLPNIGKWQYELRLGHSFGDGIPMISWLAMGLHDASSAPGWYNGAYTVSNFIYHNRDPEAAAEASKQVISQRLDYLKENPGESAEFFRDKILSQWNEPTYQSLWNNQVREQAGEKWGFARYACEEGEDRVTRIMDMGVQFIFFGMLLAALHLTVAQIRKNPARKPYESALFLIPLLFLGGFLYHALFEAKSQYVIAYVTFMIPYAVWGYAKACRQGKMWIRRFFKPSADKSVPAP